MSVLRFIVIAVIMAPFGSCFRDRERKMLSFLSIIRFDNGLCSTNSVLVKGSGSRNGTCYTTAECAVIGGQAAGTCAGGFGVCCLFAVSTSGSTVIRNRTYIRNPGFPSMTTDSNQVQFSVAKIDCSVCFLRLDFECFTLMGTGETTEVNGGVCRDQFIVTTSSGQMVPTICGSNSGEHIYVELGNLCTDTATLTFNLGGGSTSNRQWEIKASQIPCGSLYTPPPGCLQFHTGVQGRITSFNFLAANENHLQDQRYSVCLRQEEGFCCAVFTVCADSNSFSLAGGGDVTTAMKDNECTMDYVAIPGSSSSETRVGGAASSKYCGPFLSQFSGATANTPIFDCTCPFQVEIFTDSVSDVAGDAANTASSRGVCLDFTMLPCK